MVRKQSAQAGEAASFSLKLGRSLEAHASGWGVAALPLVLALILGAGAFALALR